MSMNESDIFEGNNLYIQGNNLKNSINNILEEFNNIYFEVFKEENFEDLCNDLDTSDIYIKTIEEDVEEIIIENREKITSKKRIFNLDKNRNDINGNKEKKHNHLRNEAKLLEESIKGLHLANYQELKNSKFSDCTLFSYHFFKQFCKKEIGKENNYIFNFKDNYLNDMTKIDKEFFEDYFKLDKNSKFKDKKSEQESESNFNRNNTENEDILLKDIYSIDKKELIYEFAIYHPFKNSKTQQISVAGSCHLYDLRDKIYCVLDEIHSANNQPSFFFIENTFYNDTRFDHTNTLSSKISENKIRKLNFNSMSHFNDNEIEENKFKDDSKFPYDKFLYSSGKFCPSEVYEELSMNDLRIEELNFRIGYPYLYRHIDFCDHMIMLLDIRLSDMQDKFIEDNAKSLVTFQKKLKRRICDGCFFYYAKFISINDKIGGDNNKVLFYCEYCLKKLHEKEIKDNILGNLKLIPYYHD